MSDVTERELNLQIHRAPASVWDRRGWNGTRDRVAATRLLLAAGGVALALQAARQRTWTGGVLAGAGGALAYWALTAEGDLSQARELCLRVIGRPAPADVVEDASEGSFPASDPPAWTPTTGTGLRRSEATG